MYYTNYVLPSSLIDNYKIEKGKAILPMKNKATQQKSEIPKTNPQGIIKNFDKPKSDEMTRSCSMKRDTAKTEEDYLTAGEYSDDIYQYLIDKQVRLYTCTYGNMYK